MDAEPGLPNRDCVATKSCGSSTVAIHGAGLRPSSRHPSWHRSDDAVAATPASTGHRGRLLCLLVAILAVVNTTSSTRVDRSSPSLEKVKLFRKKPIKQLIIDEASQLQQGVYPQLLARHSSIGRIAFFRDHHQLAPFRSETLPAIKSVFELDHLKTGAHMLTNCYKLPKGLCSVISEEVYQSRLTSAPSASNASLASCVNFIVDVGQRDWQLHQHARSSLALLNRRATALRWRLGSDCTICRLGQENLLIGASIMSCFQAMSTLAPRDRQAEVEGVVVDESSGTTQLVNKRYNTQVRRNTRQRLEITTGEGRSLAAVATGNFGRRSNLSANRLRSNETVKSVTVHGREDPGVTVQKNMVFWRQVLSRQAPLDPSGLLYPLLRRIPPVKMPAHWQRLQALLKQPAGCQYNGLRQSNLDPSQEQVAEALLAPLMRPLLSEAFSRRRNQLLQWKP